MSYYAAAAIVAIDEQYYKDYLTCCEHLQIDPSVVHEKDFIKNRIDALLDWHKNDEPKAFKKLNKRLKWFIKNYGRLVGLSYGYAKRSAKLIAKGDLILHDGTVNDEIFSKELSNENYQSYRKVANKKELKILGYIGLGILVIGAIVLAIVLL